MAHVLSSVWRALKPGGHIVLVCGKAAVDIGKSTSRNGQKGKAKRKKKKVQVRVSDLCLVAADRVAQERRLFSVEAFYIDRVVMKRGSYFAVHSGRRVQGNGASGKRYGEDEIVVLKKLPRGDNAAFRHPST